MPATVLHEEAHARIIADQARVCATAGVQTRYLKESATLHCTNAEIDWVRKFRTYEAAGSPGLLLCGVKNPDAHCQALCAALVRNYIDARVMPLNTVLDLTKRGQDLTEPHVLLIPNLYVSAVGKSSPWKIQELYDVLLARSAQNRTSVVYAETMEGLVSEYGKPFADHLAGFVRVG